MTKEYLRQHFEENAARLREIAKGYRETAGQLLSDPTFADFALSRAVQNEQWAKEDEEHAKLFA